MTLYLTGKTPTLMMWPRPMQRLITAVKLYPAGCKRPLCRRTRRKIFDNVAAVL